MARHQLQQYRLQQYRVAVQRQFVVGEFLCQRDLDRPQQPVQRGAPACHPTIALQPRRGLGRQLGRHRATGVEEIAPARNGGNHRRPKQLAQHRHLPLQVVFCHCLARPHPLQQLGVGDRLGPEFHQRHQHRHGLRPQDVDLAADHHQAGIGMDFQAVEMVHGAAFGRRCRFVNRAALRHGCCSGRRKAGRLAVQPRREPITAPRHRVDDAAAQQLAQCRDVHLQVVALHHQAGPDGMHQLALAEHAVPVQGQREQHIESA